MGALLFLSLHTAYLKCVGWKHELPQNSLGRRVWNKDLRVRGLVQSLNGKARPVFKALILIGLANSAGMGIT